VYPPILLIIDHTQHYSSMKYFITTLLLSFYYLLVAQTEEAPKLTFSGYVETYYCYDFDQPQGGERPSFLYNFDRHNEFNANLALLKATYQHKNVRGNVGLMAGTYAQANLAVEPDLLEHIYEANVGFKISKKQNIWLDMGVLNSHIGFESAIGKDCWTLSRSIIAENSPYYETGAKLSYTSRNEKWFFAGFLLNGWQRIKRVNDTKAPDIGTQITYKPTGKITLNWSTYYGNEGTRDIPIRRFFNNFYVQAQLNKKWGLIFGADIGAQQISQTDNNFKRWTSRVLIARYSCTDKIRLAARLEDYVDPSNIVLNLTNSSFNMRGVSFNFDYLPAENAMFRLEPRLFFSPDLNFVDREGNIKKTNLAVTAAFSLAF
jgi:Putative beta-barrel porin-2, OmpL-like. bbp2